MCIVLIIGLIDESLIVVGLCANLLGILDSQLQQGCIALLQTHLCHGIAHSIIHAANIPVVEGVVAYIGCTEIA